MKIAVATDDLKTVTGHVGRCNAFIIYDVENDKIVNQEIRENNFTHHRMQEHHGEHSHEHRHEHHHSHQDLVDALKDCSHLICCGVGRRAIDDLDEKGIKVIITDEHSAEDAAIKLSKGILSTSTSLACDH
jgi:predicted Fe-Mo cluster-binding NifX family protein